MKKIDFTHTGGFPLTQEKLDYLQQAYTECVNAFSMMGGDGTTPILISGMVSTIPSPGSTTITDGWFFYNGEMIPFTGGTVTPTGPDVPLVIITPASTSLTYYDGSVFPAVLNTTATLTSGPTVTDATHFPLSALQPFQVVFGQNGREPGWNGIIVGTPVLSGGVSGTIYYKKNFLTNTLHIRASLNANNAQNFSAAPAALNYLMGTLPAGYIPNNVVYFTTYYFASNLFKDDVGVSWVKQMTSSINPAGQVLINFLKPDISVPAYTVMFNTVIPLD